MYGIYTIDSQSKKEHGQKLYVNMYLESTQIWSKSHTISKLNQVF